MNLLRDFLSTPALEFVRNALLAIVMALAAAPPAAAQHLFEPELGFKTFDGRVNDYISPGLSIGGNYARITSSASAVTIHIDWGIHGTRSKGDYTGNPGGSSFGASVGTMRSPGLRTRDRTVAPYGGAAFGYGTAGISPGKSAWTFGVEAGGRFRISETRDLSLGVRVARLFWTDSTGEWPASNEYALVWRWSFQMPV